VSSYRYDARGIGHIHRERTAGNRLDSLGLAKHRCFDRKEAPLFDELPLLAAGLTHIVAQANRLETKR